MTWMKVTAEGKLNGENWLGTTGAVVETKY